MWRATLYIMACSGKNRLRRRLQRLREPRYLLGAVAGLGYLYFAFFSGVQSHRDGSNGGRLAMRSAFVPILGGVGPPLAGLVLLLTAGASLAMPFRSHLLDFSRAEREFLFSAPVSRRQLLCYRLVRSLWAPFFSALIVALTIPLASPPARLRGFVGMWLVLMTCHVAFAGVTLTRKRAPEGASRAIWLAWAPRLAIVGAMALIVGEAGRAIGLRAVYTLDDALSLLATVCADGLPYIAVWPFVAVVRPLFAESLAAFATALSAALAICGLAIAWVLAADQAFDALGEDLVEERIHRPKGWDSTRVRPTAWTLALHGRPEMVFVWKTATQTLRSVDRRVLFGMVLVLAWLTMALTFTSQTRGLAQAAGFLASAGAGFAVLVGPQILRLDLRQDLRHLELLKTWPVRPAALVRGEMIWPVMVIVGVAWVLGMVALVLSATAFARTGVAWRLAAGWAAMILAPALVLMQYTIHAAAALLFPAWIVSDGPRGLDSMGQRLIVLGGTMLMLVLAVAPGAIVGGLLWIAFSRFVGPWILVPWAAIAAAIVTAEAWLATEVLGRAYERLDLTSIEREE